MKAYIAGTYDTKGLELDFLRQRIAAQGLETVSCDLSTSGAASQADVSPKNIAAFHPQGESAVFIGDRGTAIAAMAEAFAQFIATRHDVGGLVI